MKLPKDLYKSLALTSRKEVFFAAIALTLGLFVSLIICEILIRLLFVYPPYPKAYLPLGGVAGASLSLKQEEYSIVLKYNRSGFRGADFPTCKLPEEHRILILGDSFAEGFGVTEEQRFSTRLAGKLHTVTRLRWSDVNLGQTATNPISYFNNLINFGLRFDPDVVVFTLFMGNDFMGGRDAPPPAQYKLVRKPLLPPPSFWTLGYLRSYIGRWINHEQILKRQQDTSFWEAYFHELINREFFVRKSGLSEMAFTQAVTDVDPTILQASFAGKLNPSFLLESLSLSVRKPISVASYYSDADYQNVLETILAANQVCNSVGSRFIVLIVPDIYQVYPAEFTTVCKRLGVKGLPPRVLQLAELRQRLITSLTKNQVEALDLTEALRAKQERTYYLLDSHWTAAGHEVAAQELEKLLSTPKPTNTTKLQSPIKMPVSREKKSRCNEFIFPRNSTSLP